MTGVVPCPNPVCGHPVPPEPRPAGPCVPLPALPDPDAGRRGRPGAGGEPRAPRIDPGLASTFDDDPGDWLDPIPPTVSSGSGHRALPSSVLDGEVTSGMGGAVRLGRYRVLGLIGEGRFARVYRGHDPILERAVALKVPRPGVLSAGEARERFLGEARCWPDCGIRRSSRSSRWAATTIVASSPWGWSRARASSSPASEAPTRSAAGVPRRSSPTWPTRSTTPTGKGSCIATSSRRISSPTSRGASI